VGGGAVVLIAQFYEVAVALLSAQIRCDLHDAPGRDGVSVEVGGCGQKFSDGKEAAALSRAVAAGPAAVLSVVRLLLFTRLANYAIHCWQI